MNANFLSHDQVEQYHRDGYVFVESLFTPPEVAAMIAEVEGGNRVASSVAGTSDAAGKKSKLAIWFDIGDDIWGAASTCPRIVNNVRILLGEETAFFHGKVMLKEARSGGAWEWHQDYGYWYDQGFLYPRMLSAIRCASTRPPEKTAASRSFADRTSSAGSIAIASARKPARTCRALSARAAL